MPSRANEEPNRRLDLKAILDAIAAQFRRPDDLKWMLVFLPMVILD
jgi:hypothetical protein